MKSKFISSLQDSKVKSGLALAAITALGGFLRFYNLNWDRGLSFHPDERNIAAAVSRISFFDQMDPKFFAYGGFLIYLYRAGVELVAWLTNNPDWLSSWGKINLAGRFFSALFSTLTIPAVWLAARNYFKKSKVAWLSCLLAAFTVSFIQIAHFSISENLLVLLSLATSIIALEIYKKPTASFYLWAGLVLGTATASKISGLSLLVYLLTTHFLVLLKKTKSFKDFLKKNYFFLGMLALSFLSFTLFSPYTFLSWDKFMESMRYESGVATGALEVPYTLQFLKTKPYLFQLSQLFWQIGPVSWLAIVGFASLPFVTGRIPAARLLIFFSFPVVYFAFVGLWHTKFIRFMMPILPFLIISAAAFLCFIWSKRKLMGQVLISFSAAATAFWGLAFFSIYTREQTRIAASDWIYNHISPSAKILEEHWDDRLPVAAGNRKLKYKIEDLTIYEPDNQEKADYYANKLAEADYIILSSRRLYGTLINLSEKYPVTSRYYKLLFGKQLGFEKKAEFSSYPKLLGISINDDRSEETFQVYDHPKVIIFKKTRDLSYDQYLGLLDPYSL